MQTDLLQKWTPQSVTETILFPLYMLTEPTEEACLKSDFLKERVHSLTFRKHFILIFHKKSSASIIFNNQCAGRCNSSLGKFDCDGCRNKVIFRTFFGEKNQG